jgi:hypothetical protein
MNLSYIDKGSKKFSRLSIGLSVLVVDFCTNNSYEKYAIKVCDEGMRRFYSSKFGQSATAIILLKCEEVAPTREATLVTPKVDGS